MPVIAQLRGAVAALDADAVVIDVAGVGYRVHVPAPIVADLREGDEVTLHTYLHVRESELTLYGARDAPSLGLFTDLLSVNGVGPKAALAMLSSFDAGALADAIVHEDLTALTSVHGVGRKTAQRVVLDLKPKLESAAVAAIQAGGAAAAGAGSAGVLGASGADLDAIAALTALGYTPTEARRALVAADAPPDASVEERITAALRALGTSG
jgi:Holliday junction DNA helicase RuvA